MSWHVMDYLPFDYNRYIGEILPLLRQAQAGDLRPLLHLVRSVRSFSLWPLFRQPRPFPQWKLEVFPYHTFADLKQTLTTYAHDPWDEKESVDPWPILEKILPTLVDTPVDSFDEDAALLYLCLLYTFCCDLPPEAKVSVVIFEHEEPAAGWKDYIARDEETKALWAAFHHLPPAPLAALFSTHAAQEAHGYGNEYSPRTLDVYGKMYASPTGFITPQEAVNLLAYTEHLHEEPVLSTIMSGCIRDAQHPSPWPLSSPIELPTVDLEQVAAEDDEAEEAMGVLPPYYRRLYEQWMHERPAELTELMHRYYRQLWEAEDEIMLRLRYAVARGWGMLEVYD